jgi:hypothetical protein
MSSELDASANNTGEVNSILEISDLISDAGNCVNKRKAIHALELAEKLCLSLIKDGETKAHSPLIEILSRRAREADFPSERYSLWKRCIRYGLSAVEKVHDHSLVDFVASKIVHAVQDGYSATPLAEATHYLS